MTGGQRWTPSGGRSHCVPIQTLSELRRDLDDTVTSQRREGVGVQKATAAPSTDGTYCCHCAQSCRHSCSRQRCWSHLPRPPTGVGSEPCGWRYWHHHDLDGGEAPPPLRLPRGWAEPGQRTATKLPLSSGWTPGPPESCNIDTLRQNSGI